MLELNVMLVIVVVEVSVLESIIVKVNNDGACETGSLVCHRVKERAYAVSLACFFLGILGREWRSFDVHLMLYTCIRISIFQRAPCLALKCLFSSYGKIVHSGILYGNFPVLYYLLFLKGRCINRILLQMSPCQAVAINLTPVQDAYHHCVSQ